MSNRKAITLLEEAITVFKQRAEVYGDAAEHYEGLAALHEVYFSQATTPRDVVMKNVLEKLDRAHRADPAGETFKDSILDAINYLAIAWEVS